MFIFLKACDGASGKKISISPCQCTFFFVHVDTIIQIIASSLFYKEKRKRRVQKRFKQLVYQLKKKRESDLSYLSLFLFQSQRDQFHIPHKLTPFPLPPLHCPSPSAIAAGCITMFSLRPPP